VWDEVAGLYGEGVSPICLLGQDLVRRAELQTHERVIDIGCGNGWGLVPAAHHVTPEVVVGLDSSFGMLVAARQRIADAGLNNVRLIRSDARRPGLADGAFDAAIASSVFQFLGYSPDALVAWGRLLKTGGRLVLSVPLPGLTPVSALLRDLLVEMSERLPPDLAARLRHLSPEPPDLRSLCLASGYYRAEAQLCEVSLPLGGPEDWWRMQWSHGARGLLRALDPQIIDALRNRAFDRLQSMTDQGESVVVDLRTMVCIAHSS
jgi:SAM-dependent methyltransferase